MRWQFSAKVSYVTYAIFNGEMFLLMNPMSPGEVVLFLLFFLLHSNEPASPLLFLLHSFRSPSRSLRQGGGSSA